MNKFEQLIEYVINDEESKARELFHDIVVEKSREIYENLMAEEADEDLEEGVEDIEEGEEDLEEDMGGDASDDLIDDVEAEEESDMNMEGDDMDDMGLRASHGSPKSDGAADVRRDHVRSAEGLWWSLDRQRDRGPRGAQLGRHDVQDLPHAPTASQGSDQAPPPGLRGFFWGGC